ncbi:hypothetical protein RhiirB3_436520 [Rhizophagus irregularis]|nr:hypothetical protein RhiirB3_436520 [Rhizophagus irregularis]
MANQKKSLNCDVVELIRSLVISANISDAHFQHMYYDKNLKKMAIYFTMDISVVTRASPHPNLLAIRDKLLYAFKKKVTIKVTIGLGWASEERKPKDKDSFGFGVSEFLKNESPKDS